MSSNNGNDRTLTNLAEEIIGAKRLRGEKNKDDAEFDFLNALEESESGCFAQTFSLLNSEWIKIIDGENVLIPEIYDRMLAVCNDYGNSAPKSPRKQPNKKKANKKKKTVKAKQDLTLVFGSQISQTEGYLNVIKISFFICA